MPRYLSLEEGISVKGVDLGMVTEVGLMPYLAGERRALWKYKISDLSTLMKRPKSYNQARTS